MYFYVNNKCIYQSSCYRCFSFWLPGFLYGKWSFVQGEYQTFKCTPSHLPCPSSVYWVMQNSDLEGHIFLSSPNHSDRLFFLLHCFWLLLMREINHSIEINTNFFCSCNHTLCTVQHQSCRNASFCLDLCRLNRGFKFNWWILTLQTQICFGITSDEIYPFKWDDIILKLTCHQEWMWFAHKFHLQVSWVR